MGGWIQKSLVTFHCSFFCLIGCSQLSITLINWISTLIIRPLILPSMDFSEGIPENFRTLVVIPSMFNDQNELKELIENLEVRFLANRGANMHFALLTDFKDSKSEIVDRGRRVVAKCEESD